MHSFIWFLQSNHCNGLLNLYDTILDSRNMNNIDAETDVAGYANNLSHLYEISCFYEVVFMKLFLISARQTVLSAAKLIPIQDLDLWNVMQSLDLDWFSG